MVIRFGRYFEGGKHPFQGAAEMAAHRLTCRNDIPVAAGGEDGLVIDNRLLRPVGQIDVDLPVAHRAGRQA
jgi:hypothetical protein